MAGGLNDLLKSKMQWMPARLALAVMAFFGFINLYMVRVNLSVIIVAMVGRNVTEGEIAPCLNGTQDNVGLNDTSRKNLHNEYEGELDWDETIQGLTLAGFFYGYAITQIIGGRLSEVYGTKWVFGGCIFAGGVSALLSPVVARAHYGAFIALRVIQGICQGVSWPSMHPCISRWIPPLERSRFVAIVYLASSLSVTLTLPLCGLIIDALGWAAAFYVTGTLSLVWCVFWFSFMHNSPDEHPRITTKELNYIQTSIQERSHLGARSLKLPLKSILTSLPVWAIIMASIGNNWGLTLFIAQLPTYMKNILGFSIKENGFLSALPFLMRYVGAVMWSNLGDWLTSKKYLSIGATRKIFSVLAMWGPAAMVFGVAFSGCNWQVNVSLICVSMFCNGAVTASILVNHTDIAPNFSGTLFGMDNTAGSIMAFVVPVLVGVMTDGKQTLAQWQKVFWICVPMYAVTELFYLVFSSGTVQPWNDGEPSRQDCPVEN